MNEIKIVVADSEMAFIVTDEHQELLVSYNGYGWVITAHNNIHFAVSKHEYKEFQNAINEASRLLVA